MARLARTTALLFVVALGLLLAHFAHANENEDGKKENRPWEMFRAANRKSNNYAALMKAKNSPLLKAGPPEIIFTHQQGATADSAGSTDSPASGSGSGSGDSDMIFRGHVCVTTEPLDDFSAHYCADVQDYGSVADWAALLSGVTKIDGFVAIYAHDSITDSDLDTIFDSVEVITEFLLIGENPSMHSLQYGFSNLREVRQDVAVEDNPMLENFDAFPSLQIVLSSLLFAGNGQDGAGMTMSGFQQLRFVGYNGYYVYSIEVEDNKFLGTVSMWPALIQTFGGILIEDNDGMTGLNGFDNLVEVRGPFYFQGQPALVHINAFHTMKYWQGDLSITGHPNLVEYIGFGQLEYLNGVLNIEDNDNLLALPPFENLVTVTGKVDISSNAALENIEGFPKLRNVFGDVAINHNDALLTIAGFGKLRMVAEDIEIIENPVLTHISAFASVSRIVYGLNVIGNPLLETVQYPAFSELSRVGGNIWIFGNPNLSTLSDFSSLAEVVGSMDVYDNKLVDLCAFSALKVLEGPKVAVCNQDGLPDPVQLPTNLYAIAMDPDIRHTPSSSSWPALYLVDNFFHPILRQGRCFSVSEATCPKAKHQKKHKNKHSTSKEPKNSWFLSSGDSKNEGGSHTQTALTWGVGVGLSAMVAGVALHLYRRRKRSIKALVDEEVVESTPLTTAQY